MRTAIRSSPTRSIAGSSPSSRASRFGPSSCAPRSRRSSETPGRCACCVLLGEDGRAREELYGELTALAAGEAATTTSVDVARRAVVAVLRSRDRDRLVHDLDRELLGLDRPARHAVAV